MEEKPEHAEKRVMMELMELGRAWQEVATMAGVRTSRSTASRWFQQYRTRGEAALQDGRRGHISKMRKPIQAWLETRCGREPSLPSTSLQKELNAHFGVLVSITHLNRIRPAHGLERQPPRVEKKR